MITDKAVRRIARREKLPAGMVEKDYVISWLLKEVYDNPVIRENLAFKGGTALKKVYFPDTWRLSHDLDFTLHNDLKAGDIKEGIKQAFTSLKENSGILFSVDSFHVSPDSIIASLQFKGPLVHKNRLRTDITLTEKLLFAPQWKKLKTVYPDVPEFRVKVYTLKEILIEKLRSIIQRGKSRDYYDVWRLLKVKNYKMEKIDELLEEKCKITQVEYRPELIFDRERLKAAERHWKKALRNLTKELPDFPQVIYELKKEILPTDNL